ncbi:hypothetical protein Sjap_009119 [Stephania japonica]|uniref:PPM-type phosphatase domain-containing protein n=1 Tax=Stephania japonica TaxID=461633 RepID=A0AAP0JT42_9MAGN
MRKSYPKRIATKLRENKTRPADALHNEVEAPLNLKRKTGNVFASDPDEVDNEISASSVRTVTHGIHMVEGKLDHAMEDYIVVETKQLGDETELSLYEIFDEHPGEKVAEYLQNHLFDKILNETDFWTDTKNAAKWAYKKTDDDILEKVASSRSGSTVQWIMSLGVNELRLRANEDIVSEMPEVITEKVFDELGNVPRVDGQLAMARVFGDGKLKKHITSEPDVMSNQEPVYTIKHIEDAQAAAEELVGEALHRHSVDDISSIVVRFE